MVGGGCPKILATLPRACGVWQVRGFRIELEAVEAVLKEYKPPLKQLAVVAVKEQRGNELATLPAVHSVVAVLHACATPPPSLL